MAILDCFQHFIVNKNDFNQSKVIKGDLLTNTKLESGQILVEIEKFALTANNISYAATGDSLGYWHYFPTTDNEWGNIPVWGYATVTRSEHNDIRIGERLFGYFPMSTHLIMQPERVKKAAFIDQYAHRKNLHESYNRYTRISDDPSHLPDFENLRPALFGLFATAFLLDDFMEDNRHFAATQLLLISASSKTSVALAYLLNHRPDIRCIGLTSETNKAFVEGLGFYDQVINYNQINSLSSNIPTVSVDFAGNGNVLSSLHKHYQNNLKHSCLVGKSHWTEKSAADNELAGVKPKFFFAPDHIAKRYKEWGEKEFDYKLMESWKNFVCAADKIYNVKSYAGIEVLEKAYKDVLAGKINPSEAVICSMNH